MMRLMVLILPLLLPLVCASPALPADLLAELNPPATAEEKEIYQRIKDDPKEVRSFLETRKFVRRYEANPETAGPPVFDFKYAVDGDEQFKYFRIVADHKTGKKREKPVPAPPVPVFSGDPLKELDPPATAAELEMYEKIKGDPKEVRSFLDTRKYIRRYNTDPKTAGPVVFDWKYALDGAEQWKVYKIKEEEIRSRRR